MTAEHTGTIQDTHTLGSAHPGGDSIPVPSSPGNHLKPVPLSKWYVTHRDGVTHETRISRATGLTYQQIRRLRKFAAGQFIRGQDLGLDDHAMTMFLVRLRKKMPLLEIKHVRGRGWIVDGEELAKLRLFLGMEE